MMHDIWSDRLAAQLSQASYEKTLLCLEKDMGLLKAHCEGLKEDGGRQVASCK